MLSVKLLILIVVVAADQSSETNSTDEASTQPVTEVTTSNLPGGLPKTSTNGNDSSDATIATDYNKNNTKDHEEQNIIQKLLKNFENMDLIFAFPVGVVTGMILSALIACLAAACRRCKKKRSRNLSQSLEMVTTQAIPKVEDDEIQDQEEAEGVESDQLLAPDGDAVPKEAEYSDIDFSAMRMKNPTEEDEIQETTETEYAEIKREDAEERRVGEEEGGATSVGDDETEVTAEVGEAVSQSQNDSGPAEEALSAVNEIMAET